MDGHLNLDVTTLIPQCPAAQLLPHCAAQRTCEFEAILKDAADELFAAPSCVIDDSVMARAAAPAVTAIARRASEDKARMLRVPNEKDRS